MRYLALFIAFMISNYLTGQLYFCGSGGEIGVFYPEDCSYVLRSDDFGITYRYNSFLDIALHPDGRLFGIDNAEEGSVLVEIDWISLEVSDTLAFIPEKNCNSLVCNESGVFYMGLRNLYSYNLLTEALVIHGSLPPNRSLIGDLLFVNNDLIGSSSNGQLGTYFKGLLYKIDIDTPENSELIMTLPNEVGMVGLATDCDSGSDELRLLGSDRDNKDSYIAEIQIEQNIIDTLCLVILPFEKHIAGLTSSDEFRQNCSLRLDLDRNNSSGRLLDHYYADSFCVVDFPIGDEDLEIQTAFETIDSLEVAVVEGILAPGEEFLVSDAVAGLRVIGEGTDQLRVINEGGIPHTEVERFLKSVRFQIGAAMPMSGERKLHTTLYAGGTASDIAKSFISVTIGSPPSAGQDAYVEVCYGESRVNLFERIGGNPREGGWWEPPLHGGENRFYAIEDTSGFYHYIVQEGGCGSDTAVVEVFKHLAPPIGLGSDGELISIITACPGDTIRWDISLPNGISYWWRDGTIGPVATITEEGVYAGEVTEENGCFWYAKTFVDYLEPVQLIETVNLCQGEEYAWQDQIYTRDTLLCEAMLDSYGCEGQFCLDIRFAAPEVLQETRYYCQGTRPVVEGVTVERDTNFCFTIAGPNCDAIQCITALFKPLAQGFERVETCEGEEYWFGNEWRTTTGIYLAPLIGVDGCDSIAQLDLVVHPTYEITIDTLITAGTSISIGGMQFAEKGDYNIGLSTVEGCDSLIQLRLDVQPTSYYTPGLVSPTITGWGQVFTIYTRNQQPARIRRLRIYNAWGQQLFEKKEIGVGDESQGWKATNNGHSLVPAAIYFYEAEVEDITGKRENLKGKVVVVY